MRASASRGATLRCIGVYGRRKSVFERIVT
jgi:hypothetical protein